MHGREGRCLVMFMARFDSHHHNNIKASLHVALEVPSIAGPGHPHTQEPLHGITAVDHHSSPMHLEFGYPVPAKLHHLSFWWHLDEPYWYVGSAPEGHSSGLPSMGAVS